MVSANLARIRQRREEEWSREQNLRVQARELDERISVVNQVVEDALWGHIIEVVPARNAIAVTGRNEDVILTDSQFALITGDIEISLATKYIRQWQQDGSKFYQLATAYQHKDNHDWYNEHRRHITFD